MPTEYAHSETDGLILLEIILKVSQCARPLCLTLVDNIGSTPRWEVEEAMGNTHPKSLIKDS